MSIEKKSSKRARIPRLWIDSPTELLENTSITLPKRAAHHLATVLRADDGSTIELFNGDGNNYRAAIEKHGKNVTAVIQSVSENLSESPLKSLLVQSISRGDRMDTSVQKCVELGVTQIQPVYTNHSIPALKGDRAQRKLEHWQSIAISAAEQSGRSVVPDVFQPCSLNQWLEKQWQALAAQGVQGWVLDPLAHQHLTENVVQTGKNQVILIGPETGLDPHEISNATQAGLSAIRFGKRILRTETAGPAVLTVLQTLAGDL